jgi:hypothetical protein
MATRTGLAALAGTLASAVRVVPLTLASTR